MHALLARLGGVLRYRHGVAACSYAKVSDEMRMPCENSVVPDLFPSVPVMISSSKICGFCFGLQVLAREFTNSSD